MDLILSVLRELLTPEHGWSLRLIVRVILSTALLFGYVVLLARSFGSRTFATFTSYDFLSNVAAGSLVASAILGRSIVESALSVLVLALLQWGVSSLSARSARVQRVVDNGPVVLVQDGQVLEGAMHRSRVARATLDENLRSSGLTGLEKVRFAVLESGGKISIIKQDG